MLDFVASAKYFYLGLGSFWGSADAYFDDLMIYNRALSADDVKGLNTLSNRVHDFSPSSPDAIDVVDSDVHSRSSVTYDLTGRQVTSPSRGIFISGGKKVVK